MENASKALLIAGAVLITLAVISIVMVIFNSGKEFNKNRINEFDQREIAYHNSQFNIYARILSISEFEKLIDAVKRSNKSVSNEMYLVSIVYDSKEYNYSRANNKLYNNLGNDLEIYLKSLNLDSLDKFECTTTTNEYGIINKVYIVKK